MKLQDFRSAKGLTLSDVAKKIGVTEVAVGRYERGDRIPSRDVMGRIYKFSRGLVRANDFYDQGTPDAR